MFTLVYVSSAVTPFNQAELSDLLARSRANNESLGITGMLLYKDGNFMQVLEGEEEQVLALSAKISKDPRHRGVMVLLKEHQPQRAFEHWAMAFRDQLRRSDPSARIQRVHEFQSEGSLIRRRSVTRTKTVAHLSTFDVSVRRARLLQELQHVFWRPS